MRKYFKLHIKIPSKSKYTTLAVSYKNKFKRGKKYLYLFTFQHISLHPTATCTYRICALHIEHLILKNIIFMLGKRKYLYFFVLKLLLKHKRDFFYDAIDKHIALYKCFYSL